DVSERLRQTLAEADVVYAEDTRRAGKLLRHLGVEAPLHSLFEGNEMERSQRLVADVASGLRVALISDAGTPVISDPGAAAVRMSLDRGLTVTVIPGPSAVTAAMALSGFAGERFSFEGFLPRKGKDREQRLRAIGAADRPVVLFVSPYRAGQDLTDLARVCGSDRRVMVGRELTKLHEEVWAGALRDAAARFGPGVKGELTVVIGPGEPDGSSESGSIEEARRLVAGGMSVSEAARRAAEISGVSRRLIYQALIEDQETS
ncbi:MAG: 16S rRNA (cytidine(1402)-2'-O)-methyltransferase, partial [Actinobacteria bacterium]|nr:16S rRNA (cytidine(1402)-2'-O)-methyltransferase [Actinomycetota bacterium]